MSYKSDTELFIVRFQNSNENKIMSKKEIQNALKSNFFRGRLTAIRKITVDSMEAVDFSYFKPKKWNPLWKEICEERCLEQ